MKTIIFDVHSKSDYCTKNQYLVVEQIESVVSEDQKNTTYFWDYPVPNYISVLLSFDLTKGEVYINNGIIRDNQFRVTKSPTVFRFQKWYLPDSPELNSSAYDTERMPADVRKKLCEDGKNYAVEWVDTNLEKAPAIIIDPVTIEPVLREVYFDDERQELRARIPLIPYKGYFVFQVLDSRTDSPIVPLTDFELACFYQAGTDGFPKDLMLAIRHFEKDGSPEALYRIAGIFATEPSLRDKDIYLEYLHMAASKGAENAMAESAEYHYMHGKEVEAQELFNQIAGPNSATGNFLYGAYLEKGWFGEQKPETIFDYYFKAACNRFEPALARLSFQYVDLQNPDALYRYFLETLTDKYDIIDYGLGCTYFMVMAFSNTKRKDFL